MNDHTNETHNYFNFFLIATLVSGALWIGDIQHSYFGKEIIKENESKSMNKLPIEE